MLRLSEPIRGIPDLNYAQRKALNEFGVQTVAELVDIFPRRYDDYTMAVPVATAPIGQPVTLKVTVESIRRQPGFRRRIVIIRAQVKDESGTLNVLWFNQPWLLEELKPGTDIYLSGTISFRPKLGRQMSNPLWEHVLRVVTAGTIAPVYPLTGSVAQKTVRHLMARVLDDLEPIPECMPTGILERYALPSLDSAYRSLHRPETAGDAETGRTRIAFDEFFLYRLALGITRHDADTSGAPMVPFDERFAKAFVARLPFPLTDDQRRAAWACFQDLEKARPMRRLLQGDVGSGKTIVAVFLMSMVYRANQSAVFMAPTEILAKQHAASVRRFIQETEPASLMLLTSSDRRLWEGGHEFKLKAHEAQERLRQGRVLVVGTHALLVRDMLPPDTSFVVVDEQHRFGVAQREALAVAKRPDGRVPHLLSMTATPIPRSLALTLYGDLDVSIIRTKPKGRLQIKTKVLAGNDREIAYEGIRSEIIKGRQAFIVCPLIEESDKLGVKSVTEEAKRLAAGPLKGLTIAFLHGRMSSADKDGVMNAFADGLNDVLVATTVVEVGVDIPNATLIAIEGAERFGLAQLHQLRGRVGRSIHQSFCYLLTDADGDSLDRLRVLEGTNDGFIIAEEDLKRRGEGNLLGLEQSGSPIFKAARSSDIKIMTLAKEAAETMLKEDADLSQIPEIRKRVIQLRETSHQE